MSCSLISKNELLTTFENEEEILIMRYL